MAKYKQATPEEQALSVAKTPTKSGEVSSVRTLNNYQERLEQLASNLPEFGIKGEIRDLSPQDATKYLEIRGQEIGQKTLDMERQAIQAMMRATGKLDQKATITVILSEKQQALTSRSYTPEQVDIIANSQRGTNSLATEIAYAAGLRAHELYTLEPKGYRQADKRPALDTKFQGREGEIYTVQGKGGLVREVLIPLNLAHKLESNRLETLAKITDRGVHYTNKYNIAAGHKWSDSFSKAAKRSLGWSEGAHGVRHSYAQERMHELQSSFLTRDKALETVSQEMGHFRPEITETYLR